MSRGRAGADPLTGVWQNHPVLNAIRAGLPDALGGVCAGCLMRHRCLGACIAQNYYRSGDLFAPFWFCDEARAVGLFPESRLVPSERAAVAACGPGVGARGRSRVTDP